MQARTWGAPDILGRGSLALETEGCPRKCQLWCERGPFESMGTGAILGRGGGFPEKGAIGIPGFQGQPFGNQERV